MAHRSASTAQSRISDLRRSSRLAPSLFTPESFPYPAEGVEILTIGETRMGERIWMGGVKAGIEVTRHLRFFSLDSEDVRPQLFTALRAIDGSRSVAEIATPLGIDVEHFSRLLGFLEEEELLHFATRPIEPRYRPSRSPLLHTSRSETAQIQTGMTQTAPTRREVEERNLPHGASFADRSSKTIAITSAGATSPLHSFSQSSSRSIADPIATALASLLFGSGFEKIKFIEEGRANAGAQITDLDLGLSIFDGSDIGASRIERLKEIANRSAILPLDQDRLATAPDFNATLTISIGYPRPDHHQRWISEDRTFLIVPGHSQREIRIGPIIVPGKTPCLRCYELNRIEDDFWREQVRQLRQLSSRDEPPKVASTLIASLTAQYVTLWLDSLSDPRARKSTHPLVGSQLILDLKTMQSRSEKWHNHPECGCLWLPTDQHQNHYQA